MTVAKSVHRSPETSSPAIHVASHSSQTQMRSPVREMTASVTSP